MEIDKQVARKKLKQQEKESDRESLNMDDMRVELERVMKQQADEYIQLEM